MFQSNEGFPKIYILSQVKQSISTSIIYTNIKTVAVFFSFRNKHKDRRTVIISKFRTLQAKCKEKLALIKFYKNNFQKIHF